MKNETFDAVSALVQALPSKQRTLLIAQFSPAAKPVPAATTSATPEAVLTRRQTAERFNRHPVFIDRLVKKNLLHRVVLPGSKRGCGFRSGEVDALIAGGHTAAEGVTK